jgi:hypothetical protein
MKNFKIKDCDVKITNKSNFISDDKCKRFVTRYLSHYLSEEKFGDYLFIPYEVKNKTPLDIVVTDYNNTLQVIINETPHIEITIDDYHNAQLLCEQNGETHGLFFKNLHDNKCTGLELLKMFTVKRFL